ncbi:glycosyltransferase [Thioflavicoccus mobilis 8321]|uniref:Glycosyltransferase n=1 Tax=Thioflavicoccus mobilis 8321 TaxID=765912 RepID=L0GXV4_9GAMM|nr:glycosyltransferase [Thioflavicoccus mobilis]AGA90210.1 glycosyltransferase [Thioflavicoccus mobilis 8321]
MNIAVRSQNILITGFRPGPGGVGRVMANIINGLADNEVDVHVLIGAGDHPELEQADASFQLHRLDLSGEAETGTRTLLETLQPQVVLSNRDDAHALMAAAAQHLTPRPRLAMRVGIHVPAKLRNMNPAARWRRRRQLVQVFRKADLLITNSLGARDGLKTLLGTVSPPIKTLCNPLDLAQVRQLATEPPNHPWLADKHHPVVVSVGRLVRMKDQATMLRAFALLPTDCRLVIFGEGRQRQRLVTLANRLGIAERVSLPGHTDNPFSSLARADLFVLSSRFEGSPNVITEALAVGTPVVATDCPSGPREILADGRFGRLVPVGDHQALATAMGATLTRPIAGAELAAAVTRFELAPAIAAYQRALGLALPPAAR